MKHPLFGQATLLNFFAPNTIKCLREIKLVKRFFHEGLNITINYKRGLYSRKMLCDTTIFFIFHENSWTRSRKTLLQSGQRGLAANVRSSLRAENLACLETRELL